MQDWRVNGIVFDRDELARSQHAKGFVELIGGNIELLEAVAELLPRCEDMPLVDCLADQMQYATLNPPQIIAGDSKRPCDPIGGSKTDAANLLGDDVGIVSHDPRGIRAVLADDLACRGRPHAKRVQKAHRLRFDAALANGLGDRFRALFADTRNLPKPRGLGCDHIERVGTKALHEAGGQGRADAGDEPGAEVASDAPLGGGNRRRERGDPKPRPIDRMLRPPPDQANVLARRDLTEIPHGGLRGGERHLLIGRETNHRELSVITAENHVLDHAFEDLL